MLNSKIFKIITFTVIFSLFIPIASSYGEELETLELEVKYTNGDRRDAFKTSYVVYQDFAITPFLEKQFATNPEVLALPEDHRYKIEVFVDGIYSESAYVDLKNTPKKLDIKIPLPGGIQFNVFYENGEIPIGQAAIKLKSNGDEELSVGNTNQDGKTLRYWLQPTLRAEDNYELDIFIDDFLVKSVSGIKIFTGTSVNQKIIVPVPEIVEELHTFRLFDTESQRILKDDGNYSIVLADENLHPLHTSTMSKTGEIYFSNIPSGVYSVLVLNDGKKESTWTPTKIDNFGKKTKFDLFENNDLKPLKPISVPIKDPIVVPLKDPISVPIKPMSAPKIYEPSVKEHLLSCNCIAFRFDDVQDFWLTDVQQKILNEFSKDNTPVTLGVLSTGLQFDEQLVNVVKNGIKNGQIEIANHGLDHTPITEFNKQELDQRIKTSQKQFNEIFNVIPKVYIPATNVFTDFTKQLLVENGFTHFSSSDVYDKPPYPLQNEKLYSFPRVASSAFFDPAQKSFIGIPAENIFPILLKSIKENGFAVVSIQPQEHAVFRDGESQNEPNLTQIQELRKLIDLIRAENIDIVHISEINQKVSKVTTSPGGKFSDNQAIPLWLKNTAGWWRDGHIDNDTFIQGIQFLINKGIVQLPPTSQGLGGSEIPNWVKNNAGWWAEGEISDEDFIQGINHLVNLGVIIIGI
ncbi:MAG: polysaccharide deacetylase family protein [Nitrosopumilus sp.]|nr:polysaccharide deacetylase family protein [Nitrosopumilus sp.]MDH3385023.1 polysaccharide deacetylase family protein [Nitrosopumilus sp.]